MGSLCHARGGQLVQEIYHLERYGFINNANGSWIHDVAVIILNRDIKFDDQTALPIDLPVSGYDPAPGSKSMLAGWGFQHWHQPPATPCLYSVDLEIVDRQQCNQTYYDTFSRVKDGQICAGMPQGNRGPCSGDSGSGLIQNNTIVGLVSFGRGCEQPGSYGVYTNVGSYVDWINRHRK
ncbi:mite allergen Eur m 3-like [Oppia nitens]|uniref:mite allergen Eur m 3-like n=1 Tax=Oppia nitens TaxID=1686743 RepID=UPI0023DC741C|nr:mite allergen Eur m 3-like [Oppia nitens]